MNLQKLSLVFLIFPLATASGLLAQQNELSYLDATFKLANPGSTGTCFFVETKATGATDSSVFLVTAKHVFEQANGESSTVVSRKRNEAGGFERAEFELKIREGETPQWIAHDDHDIAVMPIVIPGEHAIVPIQMEQLMEDSFFTSGQVDTASQVWLPGFPAQLESNKAGCPVLRQGIIASYPLQPSSIATTFIISLNSTEGDSGSPVILRNSFDVSQTNSTKPTSNSQTPTGSQPPEVSESSTITPQNQTTQPAYRVIGVLIGKHRQTVKTVSPFEERTVHQSLGLAIIVPSQLIRDTIEKAMN